MRNINEYILEKLVIGKDVEVSHLEQTITDDKILSAEGAQGLPSVITETLGYDDDIVYDVISEWVTQNEIKTVVIFTKTKDYNTLVDLGCPDYCLNRFVVNDKVYDDLYDKNYSKAEDKVNMPNIQYHIRTTKKLIFFIDEQSNYIISEHKN